MTWFPMHSGHPLMVHLPIVAFPLAVALDARAAWRRDPRLRGIGSVLWWVAVLGGAAAVATGLIASNRVEHSDRAHEVMTLHRNVALATLAVLLAAGLVRWRRPFSKAAAGFGLVAIAGLGATAYLGGELVYRHALGLPTEVLEQVIEERGGHRHRDAP